MGTGRNDSFDEKLLDLVSSKLLSDEKFLDKVAARIEERKGTAKDSIPVDIFNEKLTCFEAVVKYMKENLGMENIDIASRLRKSSKSVWRAYDLSKKKHSRKFIVDKVETAIPISILAGKYTLLANIVVYLRDDLGMKYSKIAEALKRDQRTIWTVYARAKK